MFIDYVLVLASGISVVLFAYLSWDIYKLNDIDKDFRHHSLPYYLISLVASIAMMIWALTRLLCD